MYVVDKIVMAKFEEWRFRVDTQYDSEWKHFFQEFHQEAQFEESDLRTCKCCLLHDCATNLGRGSDECSCLCGFAQTNQPSRAANESRVDATVSQMTTDEKIDLLGGVDGFYVRGVPRLGVYRLKMADGPLGVRNYGPATTMAAGIDWRQHGIQVWRSGSARRLGERRGPEECTFCWCPG
jgi:hypothetical protein